MPEIQPPRPIAMLTRKATSGVQIQGDPDPFKRTHQGIGYTNLRSGKNHRRHLIVRLKTGSYRVQPLGLIYTATAWKRESMGSITLVPLTNLLFKKKYSHLSISLSAEKFKGRGCHVITREGKRSPALERCRGYFCPEHSPICTLSRKDVDCTGIPHHLMQRYDTSSFENHDL